MPGQVTEKNKKARLDILMQDQQKIAAEIQQSFVGRTLKVLIEEEEKENGSPIKTSGDDMLEHTYIGRSEYDAPDVDGVVYVRSKVPLKAGDFVRVKITDAYEYDLSGIAE